MPEQQAYTVAENKCSEINDKAIKVRYQLRTLKDKSKESKNHLAAHLVGRQTKDLLEIARKLLVGH